MTTDADFEQGSMAAANAILSYLGRIGEQAVAARVLAAWNDGSIVEPVPPTPTPIDIGGRPKFDQQQARASGYSGDQCQACSSIRMKRVGSCLTCDDCGSTTSCG